MKRSILFILSLFLLSCSLNGSEKENAENKEPEKDIKGVWVHRYSSWNTGSEYAADESAFPDPPFNTFFVTDSTIDFFNYPYEYLYTYRYERKGNNIVLLHAKNNFLTTYQAKLVDTLIHFSNKTTYENNENDWLELVEKYIRDSVNLSVLDLLRKDTINYKLLEGNWELDTYYSAEDGSDPIELVFPLKFPQQFTFPIAQLDTAANKQLVQLNIEGKNRWFKIKMRSQYSFELKPYGWQVEDCPEIYYYNVDE